LALNPVEDTLVTIENVVGGLSSDAITGSTGANRLEGGAGNDTLSGGGGSDTLLGQGGNDTIAYTTGDGNDALVDGGDGVDTFRTAAPLPPLPARLRAFSTSSTSRPTWPAARTC
jgi:Ca2+-binding RTX toxin-like protein